MQVGLEDARGAMLQAGLPEFAADIFVEMYGAILDGRMDPAEPRTEQSTTQTPFSQFARDVLVPALSTEASA